MMTVAQSVEIEKAEPFLIIPPNLFLFCFFAVNQCNRELPSGADNVDSASASFMVSG